MTVSRPHRRIRALLGAMPLAAFLLAACGGGSGSAPAEPAAAKATALAIAGAASASPDEAASYTPLRWNNPEPVTTYKLPDGTLVTRVGGRARDRHAREIWGPGGDGYDLFSPNYFVRRSHDMTIYENVSPTNASERVVTLVIRPQWWLFDTCLLYTSPSPRDS